MWKRRLLIILSLSSVFLFSSCAHYEVSEVEEYKEFYDNVKEDITYDIFPAPENEQYIEDMYLFYSERDLIDNYHTNYINCKYDKEKYYQEKERITELFSDEDLLVENSDSFEYESLMYADSLDYDGYDIIFMNYEYVLFIESEYRIIYVNFFDKETNGKSVNIPEEYLPKELVDIRNTPPQKESWLHWCIRSIKDFLF